MVLQRIEPADLQNRGIIDSLINEGADIKAQIKTLEKELEKVKDLLDVAGIIGTHTTASHSVNIKVQPNYSLTPLKALNALKRAGKAKDFMRIISVKKAEIQKSIGETEYHRIAVKTEAKVYSFK